MAGEGQEEQEGRRARAVGTLEVEGTTPSTPSASRPAPSKWEVLDALHDAFTVGFSLVDIVTDILVAVDFHRKGHFLFFTASVVIFVVAQFAYAFLFTATWARGKGNLLKCVVFFSALPFGQLIPVFAYLESYRIPFIDRLLQSLNLKPTGLSEARPADGRLSETELGTAEDSLWNYIQRKYTAHAGFLAEAFVEAVPQGVLQTIAVIVLDDTTALNIFSILTSVSVVASKGYLVAYSIHRPCFAFNYVCIAADAFNLFATATWLFSLGPSPLESSDSAWWCWLAIVGMVCCAYGGFFLLLFTMLDDHLKSLIPTCRFTILSVFFEVYVTRFVAWVLAVIPCSVIYITMKLSLLPVGLFKSLDPEHASHADFYRPLFQFLAGSVGRDQGMLVPYLASLQSGFKGHSRRHSSSRDTDIRLKAANLFVAQARLGLDSLARELGSYRHRAKAGTTAAQAMQNAVTFWAQQLDTTSATRRLQPTERVDVGLALEILRISEHHAADENAEARRRMRAANMSASASVAVGEASGDIHARSEILRYATSPSAFFSQLWKDRGRKEGMLRLLATFALVNLLLTLVVWAPTTAAFVAYSSVFSLTQLPHCTVATGGGGGPDLTLPCTLTWLYIACLSTLLFLAPAVYRFQTLRTDLVSVKGFPKPFYSTVVIKELYFRYSTAKARTDLFEILQDQVGPDNATEVVSYLDECNRQFCYV